MNNYANILELLLRLRQSCDHPFLTLKAGDESRSKKNAGKRGGSAVVCQSQRGVLFHLAPTRIFHDIDTLVAKFMADSTEVGDNSRRHCCLWMTALAQESDLKQDYVTTMAQDLRKLMAQDTDASATDMPECAVCLEVITEPVITPCAHYGCRICMEDTLERYPSSPFLFHSFTPDLCG
jgi:hypothetical protein